MSSHLHHHRHWLHHNDHVRPKLSRPGARRKLIGASHRFGLLHNLHYLQISIHYLPCIGEQYSATGQSRVIYFSTNDMAPTRDWKAIPAALDTNQPTIPFQVVPETEGQRTNAPTDRSSGVGPVRGIEP